MIGYLWTNMWLILCRWMGGHHVELYRGQLNLVQRLFQWIPTPILWWGMTHPHFYQPHIRTELAWIENHQGILYKLKAAPPIDHIHAVPIHLHSIDVGMPLTLNFGNLHVYLYMCSCTGWSDVVLSSSHSLHKSLFHVSSPRCIIYMLESHPSWISEPCICVCRCDFP